MTIKPAVCLGWPIMALNVEIDVSPYTIPLKQREAEREAGLKKDHDEARALASTAIELLRKSLGAKRVAVFGSVAQAELFHPGSDVDLAVWGLRNGICSRITE